MEETLIYKFSQLSETMTYKDLQKCDMSRIVHWGQLKLLLSEILFLSKQIEDDSNGDLKMNVVYVGAAEGHHISKLSDMFPNCKFDLYDKRKFVLDERKNIKLHNEYYTNEHASRDKRNGKNILFISDIRSLEIGEIRENIEETDKLILGDLEMQRQWVDIIRPKSALLKFRLPYNNENTTYYKGKLYLQQFSPPSTELRLMVSDYDETIKYDNLKHEEKMAYFNCKIRTKKYDKWETSLKKIKIINNLDTTIMMEILKFYLTKTKKPNTDVDVENLCVDILNHSKKMGYNKYKQLII